jgi:uncharacterized protein (TIGR02302 family)
VARLTTGALPGLEHKRRLALAALWFEQIWPAIWPALGVVGGFLIIAMLDLPANLPAWPRALLPVVALALMIALLWRGLGRMSRPGAAAVDRRLERDSGLKHRPLATLDDRPAAPTAEAAEVWALHQARLRTQLGRLQVRLPRPGLAARDLRALRYLALLGLAGSVVIAGHEAPNRIAAAIWPSWPTGPAAPGTMVQAWITPPAYTRLPPMLLQSGQTPPPIPAGAHLTVSVTGGSGEPSLTLDGDTTSFKPLDASSWQSERDIANLPQQGARLAISRGGAEIAGWALTILPDKPPMVAFADPPGPIMSGGRTTARTRLAWRAEDDYGVAQVQGELILRDRPGAAPLILKAPLSGVPKEARGAIVRDLTAHPWAGLVVMGRMAALDEPGQRGESPMMEFTLPERPFHNQVAQAVIAIRKQLSLTPDERRGAKMALDAVADRPELYDNSMKVALELRATGALLIRGEGQQTVDEAQARLWALALFLEEGAVDRTAQALAQARQDARDAMEQARQNPQDQAAKTELEKRMEALREAIQKHIDALAEQARREGSEMPFDPNQPQMNARDLDRMAERAEQAAREGRMDDAKQQMAELEKLLEQLQNARPEHGEQREQRRAQRRQQGQDQMSAIQDLVQREGSLLDHSRNRNDQSDAATVSPLGGPQVSPPTGAAPGSPPQNDQAPSQAQRNRDQRVQQAMRRALGELMQRFGDLTGQVPAPLSDADTAMRDADQAIAEGHDDAAGAAQQKAIEALQKGGQSMGQQLSRQFGRGEQQGEGEGEDGQEMGEGDPGQTGTGDSSTSNSDGTANGQRPGDSGRRHVRRDPLGRPLPDDIDGAQGNDGDGLGSQQVPTEQEQARARELQDELRRRGADRTRPQPELDYIDRLLKSF